MLYGAQLPLGHECVLRAGIAQLTYRNVASVILEGPSVFVPSAWLSPDGYRVAYWNWQDNTVADVFDVVVVSPDTEPLLLASVDTPGGGISPFVRWSGDVYVVYGYTDANNDNWVSSWIGDLCGEIIDLEPYQASVPEMP